MKGHDREVEKSERMSEHEALMWNIEKDPWLNASGASLALLDQPVDQDRFRLHLRNAVASLPKLYQRVVPGLGRLSTPAWAPDPEFDFDYHVRNVELPAPGDERALLDLAATLYMEPLDRTRPLWRFVTISGLEGGGGAIWSLVHHVIADGVGQMRMAELYQSIDRDAPPPAEVDLEGIVAAAVAGAKTKESGGDLASGLVGTVRDTTGHLVRRQVGIARRIAGEVAMWPADPSRAVERAESAASLASTAARQIAPSGGGDESGSSLWTERSRHRRLERVRVEVDDLKAAGRVVGATLNDVFMAGLAEGAHRYHAERNVPVQSFNSSFVVSTREDSKVGGNSFTPVPVKLPAGPMTITERLETIRDLTLEARDGASKSGGLGALSGLVNQLPTTMITRAARSAAGRIDFATSNLRSAPFDLYCAGAKITGTVCMGPVAGTGANITAMSLTGAFDIGIFVDPQAITEPAAFRDHIESAFADLFVELAAHDESEPRS